MEYYVVRAMMIGMLPKDDIERLHAKENTLGRGLMPNELVPCLKTGEIKEFYQIPKDDDEEQSLHSDRVKESIRASKCLQTFTGGYVSTTSVDLLHEYDWNIYNKLGELNLFHHGKKGLSSRLKDLVKVLPLVLWTYQNS